MATKLVSKDFRLMGVIKIKQHIIMFIMAGLGLSACATETGNQSSAHATWENAVFSIPKEMTMDGSSCVGSQKAEYVQKCLAKISRDRTYPVILFLHGCAGLVPTNEELIANYRSLGYAVIAPNSFRREGRTRECKSRTRKRYTISLRKAEIAYALTQLPTLDWVDSSRVVLAGQSEGGNTVAEYSGPDAFAGYIITGWDCRHGLYPSGPVLAIRGAKDTIANKGSCKAGSVSPSEAVMVPNAGHSVSNYPETLKAFKRFLAAVAPLD